MNKTFRNTFLIGRNVIFLALSIFILSGQVICSNELMAQIKKSSDDNNSLPEFKVGYSSRVVRYGNFTDAAAAAKILVQELIKQAKAKYISQAIFITDLDKNIDRIKAENYNVISTTGLEYLAIQNNIHLYPFAVPVLGDSCLDKLLLLVRKDSKINSISDLKDKNIMVETVAQRDKFSIINVWLKVLFNKSGINYNPDVQSRGPADETPSKAVSSVFFRKCDAAVVLETDFKVMTELNPQMSKELKILSSSEQLLMSVISYTEMEKKERDLQVLLSTIFTMQETTAGKNFTKLFKITKFVPFKTDYLKSVTELFDEYEVIMKSGKKAR